MLAISNSFVRAFDAMIHPFTPAVNSKGLTNLFGNSPSGSSVTVVTSTGVADSKRNVKRMRNFAEYSKHVRTAIDYYRTTVGRAMPTVVPYDEKKPISKKIQTQIEALLLQPNQLKQPYSTVKEMLVEDYLVVGHGATEIQLNRGGEPMGLYPLDSARLGFLNNWDGNPKKPRYVLLDEGVSAVKSPVFDQQAMVLINRQRSYDALGLSHVEVLDLTIQALLNGDEFLLNQVMSPTPNGALNLGQTATPQQVSQVTSAIDRVKRAFIVLGGTEGAQFIPFNATEREMRMLDTQEWFVRAVAMVFQLPLILFGLHLEQNRANTNALLAEKQEGLGALLWKIQEAENACIAQKFGTFAEHNCMIFYPVFNHRDAAQQAGVTQTMTAGRGWITLNEAREQNGQEKLPNPSADQVWFGEGDAMVSIEMLDEKLNLFKQELAARIAPEPGTQSVRSKIKKGVYQ